MSRLVALYDGGDWTDASVEHVIVPDTVDLARAADAYRAWYNDEYAPAIRARPPWRHPEDPPPPRYITFSTFLCERYGARMATGEDIEQWMRDVILAALRGGDPKEATMSDMLTPYERKRIEDFRMLRKLASSPPERIVSECGKALRSTIGFLCDIIDRLAPAPSGANHE